MKAQPGAKQSVQSLAWSTCSVATDPPPWDGAIDAVASAKGKQRKWRMAQLTPGPCAYLLIDNLYPGVEQEISLRVDVGAWPATGELGAMQTETLTAAE